MKTTFLPPHPSIFCYSHLTVGTLECKYGCNRSRLFLEWSPFWKPLWFQGPWVFWYRTWGVRRPWGATPCSHWSSLPKVVASLAVPVLPWKPGCPLAAQPGSLAGPAASRGAAGGRREAAAPLLGAGPMPAPLTAFPLSFFTLGLTGVYGFGGPYGETVATGAYRAFRVAAAAGHSGAFSGNDSNRTSKFQGGNYTQNPFLRASGNGFLHFTVWSEAFLLPAGLLLPVWAVLSSPRGRCPLRSQVPPRPLPPALTPRNPPANAGRPQNPTRASASRASKRQDGICNQLNLAGMY